MFSCDMVQDSHPHVNKLFIGIGHLTAVPEVVADVFIPHLENGTPLLLPCCMNFFAQVFGPMPDIQSVVDSAVSVFPFVEES